MLKLSINTILIVILLALTSSLRDRSVKLIECWQVGTSSDLFTAFSQKEFNDFKSNGIDYIELGSGVFGKKTQAEQEQYDTDLKKRADQA